MKTIEKINDEISKLELIKKELEKDQVKFWQDRAKVNCTVYVWPERVVYKCDEISEFSSILNYFEPFKMMDEIKGASNKQYVDSPVQYRVNIDNNYYDRVLCVKFGLLNIDVQIQIDFKNLPEEFINEFFISTKRSLYNTETVYVNIPAHYKEFKEIRVPAFEFKTNQIDWFGGDKTSLSANTINSIIETIKNYK